MKQLSVWILSLFLGLSFVSAQSAEAKGLFTEQEIKVARDTISKKNLDRVFKQKGLDEVANVFFDVVSDFTDKVKKAKEKNKNFRLSAESDKNFLIYIIHSAQHITNEIDGSLMHYYGLAQLYDQIRPDFDWAIDRSGLGPNEKPHMRDALKAQLVGDY